MIHHSSAGNIKIENQQQCSEKAQILTQNAIPINSESQISQYDTKNIHHYAKIFSSASQERAIPGYNFQSLFRKKSHVRFGRKKAKEEAQKKSPNAKVENAQKQTRSIHKGHWSQGENKLYHWFLEIHNRHFIHKHLRRTDKIFKAMANFIGTRQAQQCRSHHQKMQKKYRTFYQILFKMRLEYYNTANPEFLRHQLDQNGYNIKDCVFISDEQLRNEDVVKDQYQSEERKSQMAIKIQNQEEEGSLEQEDSLMGDNYEKGLQLRLKYQ